MRPFSPQNATFTDGSPGVGSPGWYVNPRDVVSWMWSFDPYTFYVPQTTIAAKREPFEIASLLRVQVLQVPLTYEYCKLYTLSVVQVQGGRSCVRRRK